MLAARKIGKAVAALPMVKRATTARKILNRLSKTILRASTSIFHGLRRGALASLTKKTRRSTESTAGKIPMMTSQWKVGLVSACSLPSIK